MRVLKFGGTSLGEARTLATSCELIATRSSASADGLAVVASAFSGVTDDLTRWIEGCRTGEIGPTERDRQLKWLRVRHSSALPPGWVGEEGPQIDDLLEALRERLDGIALVGECTPGVRDAVLATGERLAVLVLAARLQACGLAARALDATELISARRCEVEVEVETEASRQRIRENLGALDPGEVVVITGFLAQGPDGRVLTLGRGASDYTATLLADALEAEAVEIWTDVSGVLNASPGLVPEARPLASLSYDEAAEMACLGAGVLHPKTLAPLARLGIPVIVRNTRRPTDPGTLIEPRTSPGENVLAVTSIEEVSELEWSGASGQQLSSRVFAVLDRLRARPISVHLAVSGASSAWILRPEEADRAEVELRRELATELAAGSSLKRRDSSAVIALVGGSQAEPSRLAGELLSSLARGGVRVRHVALPWQTGVTHMARTALALIDRRDLRPSARLLHASLLADRAPSSSPPASPANRA